MIYKKMIIRWSFTCTPSQPPIFFFFSLCILFVSPSPIVFSFDFGSAVRLAKIRCYSSYSSAPWIIKRLSSISQNKNHFVNVTGATFVLATHVFFINKFAGRHENLFYCKYSLEMKTRCNE